MLIDRAALLPACLFIVHPDRVDGAPVEAVLLLPAQRRSGLTLQGRCVNFFHATDRVQFSSVAAALCPASSQSQYGRDGRRVARIGSGESPVSAHAFP